MYALWLSLYSNRGTLFQLEVTISNNKRPSNKLFLTTVLQEENSACTRIQVGSSVSYRLCLSGNVTVHCIMFYVQCTLYTVRCTLYSIQCTPYSV